MKISRKDPEMLFRVKVHPRSSRSRLVGVEGEVLKIEVGAAPVRGKANREVIELISRSFGVAKSAVVIRKGEKQPRKLIAVSGLSRQDFWRILHERSLV